MESVSQVLKFGCGNADNITNTILLLLVKFTLTQIQKML